MPPVKSNIKEYGNEKHHHRKITPKKSLDNINSKTKRSVQKGRDTKSIQGTSQIVTNETYHLKQEIAGKKTRTNMCTKYPKNTLSPFHYYSGESCDNSIDEYSKNQAHIDE